MNNEEIDTPNSELIFDTPNEGASQSIEVPESNVDIDDIPIDLSEQADVDDMSVIEEETRHLDDKNADENDHAEITPGSDEDAEAAMEENDHEDENLNPSKHTEAPSKLFQLPTSRIKSIVKLIPSVHMVNSDAIAAIGKATEMFLKELVSESYQVTREYGKKTLTMAHVEGVIQTLPQFEFLDGMLI